MSSKAAAVVRLGNRLALRPDEAAAALGVSKNKLREMLPRIPHVRDGNVLLIPVRELEDWLSAQAKLQTGGIAPADAVLAEILGSVRRDRA